MQLQLLAALNAARQARRAAVLVTNLATGEAQLLLEGDVWPEAFEEAASKALLAGKSAAVEVEGADHFLAVHLPPPRIVAIGAVHITQALSALSAVLGYDLTIIDPRTAFATPERFGAVDLIADWPEDVLPARPLDAYTALVAVTHDPKIDDFPLAEALRTKCFYVGALGSRKTHAKRVERLTGLGLEAEQIGRIHAPIGLAIGASSPEEIALAILAEIVQAFRNRPLAGRA
ncbi:XdhC family protein [Rhizobium sp. SSA_523]|uniref:XdhC family protein n=1 Tax=Rhizobium sp. SSA_523 TaxID=2952477 RepID=UPI0020910282|nr:XdhC family protein [Rhizobium sp. SSA_523]MCO5729951.1 XdhC family protein [Rhizobium sp. SSA_523]WKC25031.1 XdhC family protein [Rhizobium sp. SSA_523]